MEMSDIAHVVGDHFPPQFSTDLSVNVSTLKNENALPCCSVLKCCNEIYNDHFLGNLVDKRCQLWIKKR